MGQACRACKEAWTEPPRGPLRSVGGRLDKKRRKGCETFLLSCSSRLSSRRLTRKLQVWEYQILAASPYLSLTCLNQHFNLSPRGDDFFSPDVGLLWKRRVGLEDDPSPFDGNRRSLPEDNPYP